MLKALAFRPPLRNKIGNNVTLSASQFGDVRDFCHGSPV